MENQPNPIVPTLWETAVLGAGAVSILLLVAAVILVLRTKSFSPGVRFALALLAFAVPVIGPVAAVVVALLEQRRARRPITVSP
ncbi:hypothetical protein [Arthrobacter sp. EpRS71]|uniref:hypothetical protein n=1 Tax=Arthrobacter sp. EpRS71 TaxID=1743141 RepID=UPI00074A862B|nr:hypothetical protein [Arthrobacter sp. EpRS71]KUM34746.1 hypothetical protein AR689_11550 [Arthrobacter sp. EpRS71]